MRARRCRVHRIPPRVRDDRDTPLSWGETARLIDLIWVKREAEYFCEQDWTANWLICPSGNSAELSAIARRAKAESVTRLFIVGETTCLQTKSTAWLA
ncbi:hypothetical protein [Bradyrhizobium sp. URHD0069]|uniref:hypothetical protein n=1 Tax=Bradyrhizobium sp. URHD0069 TaxID=1380355 RepID=UPI00055BA43C|nr:hypothetical protein [Bradyrhizobium sp. URHD0069]